jgi:hypothetical protein
LTSKPSRNFLLFDKQNITHDWWQKRRKDYRLFTSMVVIEEAIGGDKIEAQLDFIQLGSVTQ